MKIGNCQFHRGHTYVCGILNLTPDSFSDGGLHNTCEKALRRVGEMIVQGADLIDLGGESTRPGFTPVSIQEEIERVIPVLERIREEYDIPVSVDTYKAEVADAALCSGASMINDIYGLRENASMAAVIAAHGASVCMMHNRRESGYDDFWNDVIDEMRKSLNIAARAGIPKDRILIDPGIGLPKDTDQNLEILGRLKEFGTALGYPILLGASRKSVIGNVLGIPVEERLAGSLATTAAACQAGCLFVRVHDVKEHVEFIKMWEKIAWIRSKSEN